MFKQMFRHGHTELSESKAEERDGPSTGNDDCLGSSTGFSKEQQSMTCLDKHTQTRTHKTLQWHGSASTRTSLSPGSEMYHWPLKNKTHAHTWFRRWYRLRVTRQDLNHISSEHRGCECVGLCAYICKRACVCVCFWVCVWVSEGYQNLPLLSILKVSHTPQWPATGKRKWEDLECDICAYI